MMEVAGHKQRSGAGSTSYIMVKAAPKPSFKQFLSFVVLMALVWAGCGGKKDTSTTTGVAVTISPTSASVAGGATQQFTATVTGSTNTAVTWQVNGTAGGDAVVGTINSTGLYTAPNVLPTTTTVAVTAVSQADNTKSASVPVTLTAPAITITISPTSASVVAANPQPFTATVTGSTNTAVTWSVNGVAGGNSTIGTVSSSGVYTAPLSAPRTGITVTATSQANTAFSASAPVAVQFGNASLNGTYVFLAMQGDNSAGSTFTARAGTFQADGAGQITAGVSDSNSSAGGVSQNLVFTGAYSVGIDGRGTMTLNDTSGAHAFSFVLTSSTRGQLIEFDGAAVSSGYIRQQDPNAVASVSGSFVFSLYGDNAGPTAAVGQLTFASGGVTGVEDVNVRGSVTQGTVVVGPFSIGASGRGTVTLNNSSQLAFYIIDASTLALIEIDSSSIRTAGTAFAQSTALFSNSSLTSSVFYVSGITVSGGKPYAQAARFDTSAGGQFSGGVADVNNGGTVTNPSFASSATYNVAANGRGQISTGSSNFILWLASQKQGVIMQTDATVVAAGQLFQQQTGFQSVSGGYAFVVAGADSAGTPAVAVDGQLSTAGFGVLSGTQDVNSGGTLQAAQSLTGNLSIGVNGRATGAISSVPYDFYFVSADRFVLLSAGGSSVLSGVAERQCSDCQF
ncbi:MAG TPA: hypothetical protein VJ453_00690 [Terriglobales bacterium]|jgi:hypothetical protein|nr:hypothetical protein [Terriglobales bacterium]